MYRTTTIALVVVALNLSIRQGQSQDSEASTVRPAKAVVTYAPKPQLPDEARAKHLSGAGVCLLHVRPDGTVERAEMIQSTGQPLLDKATVDCFSKWRFVPSAISAIKNGKVKIPITYTGNYTKPATSR
jgi:TonB family protein